MPHPLGNLFEYPPVRPRQSWRWAGGPDPADPAFTVGEGAVVFTPSRDWKNHVCKAGGFSFKNILANQEFRGRKLVLDFSDVGFGVGQVFSENIEPPDPFADKAFHHLRHRSVC